MPSIVARPTKPVVQLIPEASEAMMAEKGLIVEHIVPIAEPRNTLANPTIASYRAAINTGTRIG